MKNIVFDLGGVLFARDRNKSTQEFIDFFSFIRTEQMPRFWVEYDRGTSTLDETIATLCDLSGFSTEKCAALVRQSIDMQMTVKSTEQLIVDLKGAGYRLYVLSNMSHEFIAFLRQFPVYALFDGEVVSCEEGVVKPEPRIYQILLERYALASDETLFIDDRSANIVAAANLGIHVQLFDPHHAVDSCQTLRKLLL
ncbi:MAG: HAD family phosphatase [Alistipes sp.]